MVTWPFLLVAAIAGIARASEVYAETEGYLAIATPALLIVVELDTFTRVDLSLRFAVALAVLTTMAIQALWTIAPFYSDRWLATGFLSTQTELPQDIVIVTIVGFALGGLFDVYSTRFEPAGASDPPANRKTVTLGDVLGLSDAQERLLTRTLQLTLVGLFGHGVATARMEIVATTGIALGVTLLPALLRREYGYAMDAGLVLWITVAMSLHLIGALGLYGRYQWYDEVTHTVSSTVIAGVGYTVFRALELHSNELDVPSEFRAVFIVVFVPATGIFWEVLEFASGGLFTVYGIDDIVTDMMFNGVGAMIVAVWETPYVADFVDFFRDRLRSRSDA